MQVPGAFDLLDGFAEFVLAETDGVIAFKPGVMPPQHRKCSPISHLAERPDTAVSGSEGATIAVNQLHQGLDPVPIKSLPCLVTRGGYFPVNVEPKSEYTEHACKSEEHDSHYDDLPRVFGVRGPHEIKIPGAQQPVKAKPQQRIRPTTTGGK